MSEWEWRVGCLLAPAKCQLRTEACKAVLMSMLARHVQRPQFTCKMHGSHAFLPCFHKDLTISCKIYKAPSIYFL